MRPLIERFSEKVEPVPESGCWLWTAGVGRDGYGQFRLGRRDKAHRASWMLHFGDIPHGMCVCHKCDTKICVNPAHLFLGTKQDNSSDMVRKGRQANGVLAGEMNASAKLSESQVRAIRAMAGTQPQIATVFGVSRALVSAIKRREVWAHLS